MEPQSSLPLLQLPTTCPYPEPDQSSPCPPSHSLKIQLNILPSTPGSSRWSLSLSLPLYAPLLSPYLLHAPPISFSILSPEQCLVRSTDHKLFIMKFCLLPCYLVRLRSKYSPQHSVLKSANPSFLRQCERPYFTPIQATGKIIVLYILICVFLDINLEDKRFCTVWLQAHLTPFCS
jgi:hypothetical protein